MRSVYFRLSLKILEEFDREGWDLRDLRGVADHLEIFKIFFTENSLRDLFQSFIMKKKLFKDFFSDKIMKDLFEPFLDKDIVDADLPKISFRKKIEGADLFEAFFGKKTEGARIYRIYFPEYKEEILRKKAEILKDIIPEQKIDPEISKVIFPLPDKQSLEALKEFFPDLDCTYISRFFPQKSEKDEIPSIHPEKENKDAEIIVKIVFPETDVEALKEGSQALLLACAPFVRAAEVPLRDLLCFLVWLGAKKGWWMLRFWDLGLEGKKTMTEERVIRAVSVGREHAAFYDPIVSVLHDHDRLHEWAGAEVSPPQLGLPKGVKMFKNVRVGLYRYPTASISVRQGTEHRIKYKKIEKTWEDFLTSLWDC